MQAAVAEADIISAQLAVVTVAEPLLQPAAEVMVVTRVFLVLQAL
jgi:hypothetical protein